MKLNPVAFGLACGVTLGALGLVLTLLSLMWGGGETIVVLAGVYFGYSWSFVGAFVALAWGVAYGFVGGWLLATIYNRANARAGGTGVGGQGGA
ncbi:MAG: hypothetical protein V3T08_00530 [Gemmatimonadota bacterium]